MHRLISVAVGAVLFGTAGFFAAGVASGGGLIGLTTGTTATTGTTGVTGHKVTICHRTGSSKQPFRAIRVSQNAVAAHVAHGDHVGPCTPTEQAINKKAKKKAAEQQASAPSEQAESKKAKKKAAEQQASAPSEQAKSKKPKK